MAYYIMHHGDGQFSLDCVTGADVEFVCQKQGFVRWCPEIEPEGPTAEQWDDICAEIAMAIFNDVSP